MNNSRILTNQQILATVAADGFFINVKGGYVTLKRHGQKQKEFPLAPSLEDFRTLSKELDGYYAPTYHFIACNWNGVFSQDEFKTHGLMALCGSYRVVRSDNAASYDEVCRWENASCRGFRVGDKMCKNGATVTVEENKETAKYNIAVTLNGLVETKTVDAAWFEALVAGTNRITVLCVANRLVNYFEKEKANAVV
ncbi:MAG: hypothetical protein ACRDBQ_18965 [Shewanella sp.]